MQNDIAISLDYIDYHKEFLAIMEEKNRILIRVDFNVPIDSHGSISSWERVRSSIPTIRLAMEKVREIILISHFEPSSCSSHVSSKIIFSCIANYLTDILKTQVRFVSGNFNREAIYDAFNKGNARIVLCDNLRISEGEKKNDQSFAEYMSSCADLFVNDAFSVSHRKHASIVGIPKFIPSIPGIHLFCEHRILTELLNNDADNGKQLFIIGGAKISTKLSLVSSLLDRYRNCSIFIGGAMANTFFAAMNIDIGDSLYECEMVSCAKDLIEKYRERIVLPCDLRCLLTANHSPHSSDVVIEYSVFDSEYDHESNKFAIYDIGRKSIERLDYLMSKSNIVVMNGPVGMYEDNRFKNGTEMVIAAIAKRTKEGGLISLIGGGDTISAMESCNIESHEFSHVSTGGGAFLSWLENGGTLPGIAALNN